MLYVFDDSLLVNKFQVVELPTKSQIFQRTGQTAVSPAGAYTGDESATFGRKPTESAESFVRTAESFESDSPKSESSKSE